MLTDLEKLALSKYTDERARAGVQPGNYEVDFTVHVHGTLSVGEDYEAVPPVSPPTVEALLLFIRDLGIGEGDVRASLNRMMAQAHALTDENRAALRKGYGVSETEREYKSIVKEQSPKRQCRGKVGAVLFAE